MTDLTPDQLYHLHTGEPMICSLGFADVDEMKAAWGLHREDVMDRYREEHPAGTRPFAWWLFEGVPKYGERPIVSKQWQEQYRQNWERYGILNVDVWPPMQEPQPDFLRRVGEIDGDEWADVQAYRREDRRKHDEWRRENPDRAASYDKWLNSWGVTSDQWYID